MSNKAFKFDESTYDKISLLREALEAKTNAEVVSKSLALLKICSKFLDKDGMLLIKKPDTENEWVKVNFRE